MLEIIEVIYTGNGFNSAKPLCQHRSRDVCILRMGYSNEQISLFLKDILKYLNGCGRPMIGKYVKRRFDRLKSVLFSINQDYIMIFVRQHLGKMCSYLTCSGNDYSHKIYLKKQDKIRDK